MTSMFPRVVSTPFQQLFWFVSAGSNVATGADRFGPMVGAIAVGSTEANLTTRVGIACNITEVSITAAASATGDLTAQLRVNGANVGSAQTWTAGAGASTKRITFSTPQALAVDDDICVRYNSAAGTGTATDVTTVLTYT